MSSQIDSRFNKKHSDSHKEVKKLGGLPASIIKIFKHILERFDEHKVRLTAYHALENGGRELEIMAGGEYGFQKPYLMQSSHVPQPER